jgi:hypothetical protein
MNVQTATAVMLCIATLTTGACATRSAHNAAIADIEATKAELYNTKTESQTLTQVVSELQQHRLIIAKQMDAATSAIRRATQQMEAERAALQRLGTLSRMVSQLAAQQNSLRSAIQRETKAQPRLQALVEQYKSELDEADAPVVPVSTPPVNHTDHTVATAQPGQVVAQTETAPKATLTPQAAPATPPVATPAPKPPVNQAPPEPVDQDWLSWFRDWVMSFFESIFP